jgi:hypothetical protein
MEKRCEPIRMSSDKVADCIFPSLRLDNSSLVDAIAEMLRVLAVPRSPHAACLEKDVGIDTTAASDRNGDVQGDDGADSDKAEPDLLIGSTLATREIPIPISIADLITDVPSQTLAAPAPTAVMGVPARPGLQQSVASHAGGWRTHIKWTVDAKKLQTKDNVIVSPSFEIAMERPMPFRMMLLPREVTDKKGGHCFKKARGTGSVQLKCEADLEDSGLNATVAFKISAGGEMQQRGPAMHDFAQAGVCGLPKKEQLWHFNDGIDTSSQTFSIELEAWTGRM